MRGVPMPDGIRWVGLDVHARESTLAIFDQATGELTTRRVVGRPHELLPWLRRASSCSIATQWYIVAASPGRRSSRLIAQRDTRYSSFYAGVSSHGHRTSPTISTS